MVGIIGVGAMGGGMVSTLRRNFIQVKVHDIDEKNVRKAVVQGATVSSTVDDLVHDCNPVITSLPTSAVAVQVLETRVLPMIRSGQVVLDMGTTVVPETRRLSALFAERGASLVDAPVSGGPIGSARGELYIFVGGDEEAARGQWPLLLLLGKSRVTYCGGSGCGQITKAVNQLAMGLVEAAYIESVAFGARAGVDPAILLNAIGDRSGFRQQFAEVASRIVSGEGDSMNNKSAEFEYFLAEAENSQFPAPMLRALHGWLQKFPPDHRDYMGRSYPPFWSSLMGGKKEQ